MNLSAIQAEVLERFDKEYREQFPALSDMEEDVELAKKAGGKLATNMQWIKDFIDQAITQTAEAVYHDAAAVARKIDDQKVRDAAVSSMKYFEGRDEAAEEIAQALEDRAKEVRK